MKAYKFWVTYWTAYKVDSHVLTRKLCLLESENVALQLCANDTVLEIAKMWTYCPHLVYYTKKG